MNNAAPPGSQAILNAIAELVLIAVPEEEEETCRAIEMHMAFTGNVELGDTNVYFGFDYETQEGEKVNFSPFEDESTEGHIRYLHDLQHELLELRAAFWRENPARDQPVWTGLTLRVEMTEGSFSVDFEY
ncbi:immunity protein YezG family protein [Komagataeibacter xylinus]|uniref:DUF600 domain-containing protein n=1 Tax=Komagataeibacter xylinus TaxID=28448 RepID=A0A857FMI0_KOMXY|nr:hypothetical protein [Komagataeibacter xylinus]QHC35488.1 hypothetical protein FMA36_08270 [Komagataeibacter xylinus]